MSASRRQFLNAGAARRKVPFDKACVTVPVVSRKVTAVQALDRRFGRVDGICDTSVKVV